jgi:hypothetical protein
MPLPAARSVDAYRLMFVSRIGRADRFPRQVSAADRVSDHYSRGRTLREPRISGSIQHHAPAAAIDVVRTPVTFVMRSSCGRVRRCGRTLCNICAEEVLEVLLEVFVASDLEVDIPVSS